MPPPEEHSILPEDDWQPAAPSYGPGLGMEAVPADLTHFADMLGADNEGFMQSWEDAGNEIGMTFPNFTGFPAASLSRVEDSPAGAMPEGMAFQRTYLNSYIALQSLMGEAMAGLMNLQHAATTAHMQYQLADVFGLSNRGNPFSEESGYHPDLVRSVFNEEEQARQDRNEALTEAAEEDWNEGLGHYQQDGWEAAHDPDPSDNHPPLVISDAYPAASGDVPQDQDGVLTNDAAEDYEATAPEEITEPDEITIGGADE